MSPQVRDSWFDDDAGPVVRPYTMTRGRIDGSGDGAANEPVEAVSGAGPPGHQLPGEADAIVALCRDEPRTPLDLAAELDLPAGVVRVLVGDLTDAGLLRSARVRQPVRHPDVDEAAERAAAGQALSADGADEQLLRQVIEGLRAL
jgi:hypothetical protein